MSKRIVQTKTVKASEAQENWRELAKEVRGGQVRVLVAEDGKPILGLISALDLERLALLEEERERDFEALDRTRAAFADVPEEELEREIAKAIAEVRAENRQRRAG